MRILVFSFKKTLSFRSRRGWVCVVGGWVWWVGAMLAGWGGEGGGAGRCMLKEGSAEKDAPTGLLAVLNTL